jgi:hypothetical protein
MNASNSRPAFFRIDELDMRVQLFTGYLSWEYTDFCPQSKSKQNRLLKYGYDCLQKSKVRGLKRLKHLSVLHPQLFAAYDCFEYLAAFSIWQLSVEINL